MDEQLKRRLIGAAIIMGLLVAIVPFFFEDKTPSDPAALPQALDEQPLTLPKGEAAGEAAAPAASEASTPAPATTAKSRKFGVVPLDDSEAKAPKSVSEPARSSAAETSRVEAAAPVEASGYGDEEVEDAAPAPAPAAPVTRKPAPAAPAHSVSESRAATPAPHKPATAKKPETTVTTSKPVAPKPAAAPKVADAPVKKTAPPADAAPVKKSAAVAASAPAPAAVSKPASGAVRYTVQAGTFADESNARKLADKLRKRNLPVRVIANDTGSGKVYRVTVGPNLDRTHAEQIQKQLSASDGVQGVILQNH